MGFISGVKLRKEIIVRTGVNQKTDLNQNQEYMLDIIFIRKSVIIGINVLL